MTLANDVAGPSGVVNLTSADVKLDTEGRTTPLKQLNVHYIQDSDTICYFMRGSI